MRRRTGGRGRRARRGRASAWLRWAGVCGAERARGFSGQLGRWEDFFCEARLFFIYLLRLFIWASAPTRKASTCGRGRGGLPPEQGAPGGAGARNPGTMTRTQGRPLTHWATQASLWSTFNLDTKVISVRPGSRLGRGRPSQCPLPVSVSNRWQPLGVHARPQQTQTGTLTGQPPLPVEPVHVLEINRELSLLISFAHYHSCLECLRLSDFFVFLFGQLSVSDFALGLSASYRHGARRCCPLHGTGDILGTQLALGSSLHL